MGDRPRDLATSFEFTEGTGPILVMCSVGDVLEVYKADRCLEVLTPDAVDPKQIDPNAPWIIRNIRNYGASNEIVARTVLQANQFLNDASFKDVVDKKSIMTSARSCRDSILECRRYSDQINSEVQRIVDKQKTLSANRNVITSFPTYEGLREIAGAFLFNSKQALQSIINIANGFYGTAFAGPRFHKLRDWAKQVYPDSGFADYITYHEPQLKWIVDMRNYYEHPGEKATEIRDFYWEAETRRIHLPTWNITGDRPGAIAKDVEAITEELIDVAEGIIVFGAMMQTDHFPFILVNNESLKPEIPIRYSLKVNPDTIKRK